jgi:hypothetical protein
MNDWSDYEIDTFKKVLAGKSDGFSYTTFCNCVAVSSLDANVIRVTTSVNLGCASLAFR